MSTSIIEMQILEGDMKILKQKIEEAQDKRLEELDDLLDMAKEKVEKAKEEVWSIKKEINTILLKRYPITWTIHYPINNKYSAYNKGTYATKEIATSYLTDSNSYIVPKDSSECNFNELITTMR